MGVVLLYVAAKCQQSTKVVEFREIPEPGIFWYFAYLFVAPEGAEILEGASED